ncbi:MAG: VOC family protein [Bacteroidales bacterium]|nr:VOC family protein [Bacteroidales bacterium]
MNIHHLAIWTKNIETMKDFYTKYFQCKAGKRYLNEAKGFSSYFLSFESGAKIELMKINEINEDCEGNKLGLTHFAIALGSIENVNHLTQLIEIDGHTIISYPRTTGDGYYESVIADPENNLIELTV